MKYILIAILLLSIILAVLALKNRTDSSAGNELSSNGLTSIKMGYMPFTTNWPVFVAKKNGIFEKNGLQVELVSFNSGVDAANAVISNQVSAHAVNTLVDLFNIETRSPGEIKLFALQQLSEDAYSEALLARTNSGIQKVEDLRGKKVGITPGTFTETIILAAYKDKINLRDDAQLIALAPNLQVASLESGQIDALFAYEPNITLATMKNVGYVVDEHFFKHVAEPFDLGGFTMSSETINSNPDLAEKIILSLDEAISLGNDNNDIRNAAIAEYTSLDQETIGKLRFSKNIPNSQIAPGSMRPTADLYMALGLLDGEIDVESMIYKIDR